MADVPGLKMSEPPSFGDLSDAESKDAHVAYTIMETEAGKVHRMLEKRGFAPVQAASTTAQALMNAMVRMCVVTAVLDGRAPNREWFLHNCASHFDRVVDGVPGGNADEPTKEEGV